MGWPVSHSLSPRLHGYWLACYRIDGAYVPLAVQPDDFGAGLRMLPKLGFAGVNVTVPHKEAALRAVDDAEGDARRIGAVNTVVVDSDGSLMGRNTDGFGFLENLRSAFPAWRATAGPAVVLGAGGAGRAVVAALVDGGASEVRVVNRTIDRAEHLADDIGRVVVPVSWKERAEALDGASLLVNTTTQGMEGHPALEIELSSLAPEAVVTDIVYAPLETALLRRARSRGNPVVDGLGMLLHQARPGFAAWFGREPEVTEALRTHVIEGLRSYTPS